MTQVARSQDLPASAPVSTHGGGWPTEVVLLGTGFVGMIAMSGLTPVLPSIEQAFAGEPAAGFLAKTLVTVVGLAMVIVSPLSGLVARRVGRVRLLFWSLVLFIVAGTSGFFLNSLTALVASRFLTGVGAASVVTLVLTLIGDLHTGRARERRIGANVAISALFITVLAPTAGWLGDHSWRWVFLIHLIAIPILLIIPFSQTMKAADAVFSAQKRSHATAPPPFGLAIFAVLAGSIIFSVPVLVPYHMRDLNLPGGALAGSLFAIIVLASVSTSLSYGEIRRILSAPQAFAIAFALYLVGLVIVASAVTYAAVASGLVIAGFGGGLITANIYATAARTPDPAARPRDVGLIKGAYYSGLFVGPTALQWVAARFEAAGAIYALAALCGVLCLVAILWMLQDRSLSKEVARG